MNTNKTEKTNFEGSAFGIVTFALRLVVGWTYFSAFWRRLILENKLDPEAAGYIGEKFNHFLPNAFGIKPLIEYLVTHPDALWWSMTIFTIVEAIVGFFIMIGLFTRLMSAGVFLLALGILLGSGWLGTTCLDEWQIGVLGLASGFSIFLSGGGMYSIDYWLNTKIFHHKIPGWYHKMSFETLLVSTDTITRISLVGTIVIFALTLYTNQFFHGGVWGVLHNKSVKPKVEISDVTIEKGQLKFAVYRTEGADVYGSFLIEVKVKDSQGNAVFQRSAEELASFPLSDIQNEYIAKVKPGRHSLIIPLGSKAYLQIKDRKLKELDSGSYRLELTDISGIIWAASIKIKV